MPVTERNSGTPIAIAARSAVALSAAERRAAMSPADTPAAARTRPIASSHARGTFGPMASWRPACSSRSPSASEPMKSVRASVWAESTGMRGAPSAAAAALQPRVRSRASGSRHRRRAASATTRKAPK